MNTLISCEMCLPFFCTFLLRFVLTCFLKDLVTDCLISCVKSIFWQFFGHCFQDSLSHIVWHSCDILCEIAFLYCSCNGLRNSVSHSFYFVFCISCGIYWRSFLSFFDFFWHTCRQSIQQIFWHSSWRKSECMVACGVCVDPTDHAGHGYVLQKIWSQYDSNMKVCLFLIGAGVQLLGEKTGFSLTEALGRFLRNTSNSKLW